VCQEVRASRTNRYRYGPARATGGARGCTPKPGRDAGFIEIFGHAERTGGTPGTHTPGESGVTRSLNQEATRFSGWCFTKEKMKKLTDVIRYMRNAGYELLQ